MLLGFIVPKTDLAIENPPKSSKDEQDQDYFPSANAIITVILTTFGTIFRLGSTICTLNANYDVINGLLRRSLKIHYDIILGPRMSSVMWGVFCSLTFLFAFLGSLAFYWISKVVSRKKGIILCQLLFIISSFLALWSYYDLFELLLFSHALTGFSVGLSFSFLVRIVNEISDVNTRTCLIKITTSTAWISMIMSGLMASKYVLGGETWPFLYLFPAIFNLFCIMFYQLIYKETPVYLISLAETSLALESVQFYYENSKNCETRLEELQKLHRENSNRLDFTFLETLQDHVGRKYVILAGLIICSIQSSLLWPFLLYGTEIFLRFGRINRPSSTCIVAVILVMATITLPIGFRLTKIFNPRKLLIFSLASLSMITLSASTVIFVTEIPIDQTWPALLLIVLFSLTLIIYSTLIEPLLCNGFVIVAERRFQRAIFHFSSNFTFLMAFIVTLLFNPLQHAMGYGIYIGLTMIQLICLGVIVKMYTEARDQGESRDGRQADEENTGKISD